MDYAIIRNANYKKSNLAPHLHLVFVPAIHQFDKKSEKNIDKIACSEYWKGKDSYRQLQDSFYKYITDKGFNLERGKSREIEHLSTEKLKQVTNYENIKYELQNKNIEPLNTQNMNLILAQNQELIEYTKKLKLQLNKSLVAIQKASILQKENSKLQKENELKQVALDNSKNNINSNDQKQNEA